MRLHLLDAKLHSNAFSCLQLVRFNFVDPSNDFSNAMDSLKRQVRSVWFSLILSPRKCFLERPIVFLYCLMTASDEGTSWVSSLRQTFISVRSRSSSFLNVLQCQWQFFILVVFPKKIIENAHIVKSDTLLFRKSTKLFSFYKITVYTYTLKQKYRSVIKRSKKKNGIIMDPTTAVKDVV